MPLSGTGGTLGSKIAGDLSLVDGANIGSWHGIGNAICGWVTLYSLVLPGTMVASGTAVTGLGLLTFTSDGSNLGDTMRSGAGSIDPPGHPYWESLGRAMWSYMIGNSQMRPTAFIANPTGGAVTGFGTTLFSSNGLGPILAGSLGLHDGGNLSSWQTIADDIMNHLTNNALFVPAYTSPNGGGPLVGVGTLQ